MVNEESFWKQRLKVFWLRDGDKNTKFFHASITGRRKRNKLVSTVKEDGVVGHVVLVMVAVRTGLDWLLLASH